MIFIIAAVVTAYIIGSIPTAYIAGKAIKGIDIRDHGSGNVGATNVFRSVGKIPAVAVFIIDCLKGVISVTLIPYGAQMITTAPAARSNVFYILLALASIVGHIWTCFLNFRGGKGVATAAGAIIGLYPLLFSGGLFVWIIIFSLWKYVSLASIFAAVSLPLLAVIFNNDLSTVIFMSILSLGAVYSHRENIRRLIQGKENKLIKVKKI